MVSSQCSFLAKIAHQSKKCMHLCSPAESFPCPNNIWSMTYKLKDPLCIISASFHQASTFPKTFSHNPTKKPLLPSWKCPWPKIQAHVILQKNIFLKWAYDIKSPFDPQPVPSFAGVSFLFEQCQDMLIFLIGHCMTPLNHLCLLYAVPFLWSMSSMLV